HVGYDLVDVTLPMWEGAGKHPWGDKQRRNLRRTLTALGFDEAYSFSFVNAERDRLFRLNDTAAATLLNPIDVNQSEMRTSLLTGLLDAVQHNLNQGTRDVKLFEFNRPFVRSRNFEHPADLEQLHIASSLVE